MNTEPKLMNQMVAVAGGAMIDSEMLEELPKDIELSDLLVMEDREERRKIEKAWAKFQKDTNGDSIKRKPPDINKAKVKRKAAKAARRKNRT